MVKPSSAAGTADVPPLSRPGPPGKSQEAASQPGHQVRHLLRILGPGLVTGAADDDPSGIATYSQTGAQFGYGQLRTALWMLPLGTDEQDNGYPRQVESELIFDPLVDDADIKVRNLNGEVALNG
jgi:osmotically-inducible protein OsmY